jgi:hypothetical protein
LRVAATLGLTYVLIEFSENTQEHVVEPFRRLSRRGELSLAMIALRSDGFFGVEIVEAKITV